MGGSDAVVGRRGLLAAAGLVLAGCAAPGRLPARSGPVRRVVALGLGDLETTVALGVDPVGGADAYGGRERLRDWVAAAVDGPEPELLDWRDPSLEAVAALRPDVVLYTNAPADERVVDGLRRIAPTVTGPSGGGLGLPWQQQLRVIGDALGLGSRAARLEAETAELVASAARAHPQLRGVSTTAAIVVAGEVYLWPAVDPRVRLLGDLGLRLDDQPARPGQGGGGYLVPISPERYDLLETDLLYLACTDDRGDLDPGLAASRTFEALDVVRRGRVVYAPGPLAAAGEGALSDQASAFGVGGPLGIPVCLPSLVSALSQALGPHAS